MADGNEPGQSGPIAAGANVRPATIDDLSAIRYVHAASFAVGGLEFYSTEEIAGYRRLVYSARYSERLTELVRDRVLLVAELEHECVATAAWSGGDEGTTSARIRMLHVRPGFQGVGLGARILSSAEALARQAGFSAFLLRSTMNAVGFFQHHGYAVTSRGTRVLPDGLSMPVAFLRKGA